MKITDADIRALFDLASNTPAQFYEKYPTPPEYSDASWRLAIVTDCMGALGLSDATSLSAEANFKLNQVARARLVKIIKAFAEGKS
jgi:hypothetical protein